MSRSRLEGTGPLTPAATSPGLVREPLLGSGQDSAVVVVVEEVVRDSVVVGRPGMGQDLVEGCLGWVGVDIIRFCRHSSSSRCFLVRVLVLVVLGVEVRMGMGGRGLVSPFFLSVSYLEFLFLERFFF